MSKKYEIDMTKGSILGKMIVFTIPIILTGLLQLLYNAADIAVVGRFADKDALAAVGAAGPLTNLLLNFFMGLATGSNIVLANAYGEGNKQKISDTVHTATLLSIICGIIMGIVGFFASKPFLNIMNTPVDVIDLSALYMKIIFIGMPAQLVYNFGAAMLRAIGDTRRPLYILTLTGLVNVGLNLILVIVFKMSVAGVAIATIVSQYLSAFFVLRCFVESAESYHLDLSKLTLHKKMLGRILAFGIPGGIQGTVFSLSNSIIQSAINSFGSIAVAGNAVAANIEGFVYTAENSVTQATISFTGQNFGAGKIDRIKKIFFRSCLVVAIVGGGMSMLALLFAGPLSSIYTTDGKVIEYAILRMTYICPAYVLCGIMDVAVGSLRGMGKSITSMLSCVLGVCGIRIVWVFTVFRAFKTLPVLYSSYTASWLGTSLILLIALFIVFRNMQKSIKESNMETKERIMFWDILKGLGIIAIVLGHCCPPAAPYVYTCHLALFFFVSAYFYNEKKYLNKPFDYVGNLFKNNWTKYVFYLTLIILMRNFFIRFALDLSVPYYESIGQVLDAIAKGFLFVCGERFGGAMWFVLPNMVAGAVLALSLCFCDRVGSIITTGKSKVYVKYGIFVVMGICMVGAFSRTPMIFGVQNSFLMLPVCFGAYFIRKAAGMDLSKYLKPCFALFFAGVIAVLVKYSGFRVELSANIKPGYFWLYVLSFIGIYVFMYVAKIIEKIPYFNKFIACLGKNSFAIMALHFIAIKLVDRIYCFAIGEKNPAIISKWVCSYPEKLWWVYLIAGTVLPAIFGVIMNKIKKESAKILEKRA